MREGLWWQYLLTSLLYCFGLTMLSYCRIHSITIERDTGRVLVHKRPLWPLRLLRFVPGPRTARGQQLALRRPVRPIQHRHQLA